MSDPIHTPGPIEGNITLFVEGDSFQRQRCVLPHLIVGLIDQAVPLRVVTTDPKAGSLALGPVPVLVRERAGWPFAGRRLMSLIESLAATPPTVLHALSDESFGVTLDLAKEFDAELIWSVTGFADIEALAGFDLGRVDAVVTHSPAMLERIRESVSLDAAKIHVIPPGVLAAAAPSAFVNAARTPTLTCTAAFDRTGSVEPVIQAVDILRRRSRPVALFLLGEGPEESSLRRRVRDLRLASCVTFARPTGDLTPVFLHADVFVRAKRTTAFEDDVLQAMAAGLVVVCCPSEIDDGLTDGSTAVLCEQAKPDAIAVSIERLLGDLDAARALAGGALDYVRAFHTLSGMAEKAAGLYRDLALRRTTFRVEGT